MTITPLFNLRRVIPRWRDSRTALSTGELASLGIARPKEIGGRDLFLEKLRAWQENRQIEFAAEVVSAAITQGYAIEAVEAAEFLLSEPDNSAPTVLSVASEVLMRSGKIKKEDNSSLNPINPIPQILHAKIHRIKHLLVQYPHNALMWVDLSHQYVMLGQLQQSRDAMLAAIYMAPENRFVLRSATRLFVHLDEPDRAHRLLIGKEVTRHDPWLIAAEIATAAVAEKRPLLVRIGRELLDRGKYSQFHTAELSSALATLELYSGSSRRARKLFQSSLVNPTDNSVAQSEWVKNQLPTLDTEFAIQNTPRTFEARAISALQSLRWSDALEASSLWFADESYSSRPAEVGSYVASVGFENYPLAERIIKDAQIANPNDITLVNNLAYAIANQNRLDEALKVVDSLPLSILNDAGKVPLIATRGLIKIRSGDIEEGNDQYLKAISLAKHISPELYALASINYAREMLLAGKFSKPMAISFAEQASHSISNPHINWLLGRLEITRPPQTIY